VLWDFEARTAYPAYRPAYDDPALAKPNEYFGGAKIGQLYSDIAPDLPSFRQSPVWPDTTEAIQRDVITPVMNDEVDAETALTEMKGTVEDLQKEQ
jgi:ABC-type glycerol-3-phosphate transport system substrate-binding protein